MHVTRLIVKNTEVENLQESPVLIFFVEPVGDGGPLVPEENNHTFSANRIELLDNGWVLVGAVDSILTQFFPPWRVIALEGVDGPTETF